MQGAGGSAGGGGAADQRVPQLRPQGPPQRQADL